jgi:3,4-dihydroxy 2-butanone 4-phosphate synthase/GTP cyclohydrolase II
MIVVVDDEDRENEGDLTMAAEMITPEAINFMAKYGRGLICLAMTEQQAERLHLPPMTAENTSNFGTAFTESIDAHDGVTTGISAHDRSQTIRVAIAPWTRPVDLARPGHVFPLRARDGGVLVRTGQTEAAVDLARIARLIAAGVICEIMNDDGSMARQPQLKEFCREHNMKMLTVAELVRYRQRHESYLTRLGEMTLATRYGDFRLIAYQSKIDGESHVALVKGKVEYFGEQPTLVRMHAHCLMGDVFGATSCECRNMLEQSMRMIAEEGRGAIIYLHQSSNGMVVEKLGEKITISHHKDIRLATLPDSRRKAQREIGIGAQILNDLKLKRLRVLTNRPRKIASLEGFGLEIVEQVPVPVAGAACQD